MMHPEELFVRYISFPLISLMKGQGNVFRLVRELEQSQYWPLERLRELQARRLKKLLVHAYENTEFYRKRFDECGFNPYGFKNQDDLEIIPYLTKEQIRDNLKALTARNFRASDLRSSQTGGTTGAKMVFCRNRGCFSPREAATYRFEKWAGWEAGKRVGIVWPAEQDYLGHKALKGRLRSALFSRQVVLPGAAIDETMTAEYVEALLREKPVMIRAFPSPLLEVARYLEKNGIDTVTPRGVISTGEPLYPWQRQAISRAFHCPVFDSYRSREAGPVAQECACHDGMHINAESLHVETTGEADPQGFPGEIVVTELLNYGMPFIRYRTGDLGTLSSQACPCGRGLPLLSRIEGRSVHTLHAAGGKRISGCALALCLAEDAPGSFGQVQVIQESLDHLRVLLTNDPPPDAIIQEHQRKMIRKYFGEKTRVSFEIVERIPREKSGKYLFTKCLIPEVQA